MKVVVALGGNAFVERGQPLSQEVHLRNAEAAAEAVAAIVREGHRVVVTHGNGPQVGFLDELQEAAGRRAFGLDALTAATQGMLGFLLAQALDRRLGPGAAVALVTRVEVDRGDPAFGNPTKPIGRIYSEEEARELAARYGWTFTRDPRGGLRRVVPSPRPARVVEAEAVRALMEAGKVVIAAGGGGVPVAGGGGVEAVVDKDLASALLAREIGADALVILTDVDAVYLHYGTPRQVRLSRTTAAELRRYLAEGHFPPGSMGPKVQAVVEFLEGGGRWAAVGHLREGLMVFRGERGTYVTT